MTFSDYTLKKNRKSLPMPLYHKEKLPEKKKQQQQSNSNPLIFGSNSSNEDLFYVPQSIYQLYRSKN